MSKAKDKRKARRVAAKRPARVKSIDGIISELEGQTRDISIHGIFLYLSRKVAPGSTLEIVLPLPEGVGQAAEHWVRCQCRVVRVEPQEPRKQFGVAAVIESFEPLAGSAAGQA